MRILVTGGAGYIGSVIVEDLVRLGHETTVYDSLDRGHAGSVHPAATLVRGTVGERELLAQTLRERDIEAVIHMAAFIEVGESVHHPEIFFQNNVVGSLEVLRAMIDTGVKNLVFSSTAALYGDPQRIPITEDDMPQPTNPYGESKLLVERMLRWLAEAHSMTITSLRYFNAAGATEMNGEDHTPESHLIPIVLRAALTGEELRIHGTDYPTKDGTCVRDFVHVLDLAQAHVLALGRRDAGMRVYNVGSGEGYSVREVMETVQRITGKTLNIVTGPRRAGDQIATVASPLRIRTDLGWQPQHAGLDEIISSAWRWRLAHPNGYGSL
ncbi:MAG: UDP-glucose 4-epimerase GalE [Ktedonobacterales bacterium]|nr:UDP-glucose 4-epimerase GalE [Ktedonobacterales bacterium]